MKEAFFRNCDERCPGVNSLAILNQVSIYTNLKSIFISIDISHI